MYPFHSACGSTDLGNIIYAKGKKLIVVSLCRHCHRPVEEWEITHIHPITLSRIRYNNINSMEALAKLAPLIIKERKFV
jgi:hypothetical protein